MTITKIGHCCLHIIENGVGILTDPGMFTNEQNSLTGISIIIITHEHGDHFHIDSVKEVLRNNPEAKIITNSAVAKLLEKQGIACEIVEDGQTTTIKEITISGFGKDHAVIYKTIPVVMNTGYLIASRFFLPGDAFITPNVPVEILGMPIAGPWMKISDSLDWALSIKPRVCIPIHDAILTSRTWIYTVPKKVLEDAGIQFDALEPGENVEY
ncbi:MAG: MBL fold metallo-hydrolase [Candidatus Andersenbacteria bacterium]|nr:MBL fold metallo-hydrolase [Candidatus Andersenbacteria bacterium]